jgi:hypothetical protein
MRIKNKLNRKYMQISIYVIITAVVIYILSLIAKNAPTIIKELMERLSWIIRVVRPVILGFVFAYLLNPIVGFFEGRFNKLKIFKKMKNEKIEGPLHLRPKAGHGLISVALHTWVASYLGLNVVTYFSLYSLMPQRASI